MPNGDTAGRAPTVGHALRLVADQAAAEDGDETVYFAQ